MSIPADKTEEYKREIDGLVTVCKSLANRYCLIPYQTIIERVSMLAPLYEGPIELSDRDGKLVAYVSAEPRMDRKNSLQVKFTGIEEVTLSLYRNRMSNHQ